MLASLVHMMSELKAISLPHLCLLFSPAIFGDTTYGWFALQHLVEHRATVFGKRGIPPLASQHNPFTALQSFSVVQLEAVRIKGVVKLRQNEDKPWRARHCMAKKGRLLFYKDSRFEKLDFMIELNAAQAFPRISDDQQYSFQLTVSRKETRKSYELMVTTAEDRAAWVLAIEESDVI